MTQTITARRARIVDLGLKISACEACVNGTLQVTGLRLPDGRENREERCLNCGRISFHDAPDPIGPRKEKPLGARAPRGTEWKRT